MSTRAIIAASWRGSLRAQVDTPIPASIAGAALATAGGDAAGAIRLLSSAIEYLEEVQAEERGGILRTGTV